MQKEWKQELKAVKKSLGGGEFKTERKSEENRRRVVENIECGDN